MAVCEPFDLHDVAARTLDIHEVRVRRLYEALELVLPLFRDGVRIQQVRFESLSYAATMEKM